MFALSNGLAKFQCSILTETVEVYTRLKLYLPKSIVSSPLLLPQPDILRNFFRNCILVGLRGGDDEVAGRFPVVVPDVDSNEY